MAMLSKGVRVTGASRTKLAADLQKKYTKGASIRELAEASGRSYGFIHRVLGEAGVELRGRGGATRSKKSTRATKGVTVAATISRAPKSASRPAKASTRKATAPARKVDSDKASIATAPASKSPARKAPARKAKG